MAFGSKKKSLLERIDEQLDLERQEILLGNLEAIEPMIAEREAMVAELENNLSRKDVSSIGEIENLQSKARRNAKLIRAAIEGIASANKRVAEIEAAHSRLSTYSAEGTINNVIRPKNTITKRARG